MKIVISPAKSLNFEDAALTEQFSQPRFLEQASELVNVMRNYDSAGISALMGVSSAIAELNVERFLEWKQPFNLQNAKQAIYAFKGDVYTGISIESAGKDALGYIDEHVRILSGLYGLLKPLDLMQAYRLEMGTKLENPKGKNLYAFWGDALAQALNAELGDEVLVNLASNEYFKAVTAKRIQSRVVTPVFKDLKGGQYKIVSFYAKKARGLMVRFAADKGVKDVEQLKAFDYQGYAFNAGLSSADEWVFTRDEPPKA